MYVYDSAPLDMPYEKKTLALTYLQAFSQGMPRLFLKASHLKSTMIYGVFFGKVLPQTQSTVFYPHVA